MAEIYILVKTILVAVIGIYCILILMKVYSFVKIKEQCAVAICKLESREKLQKLIDKAEANGKLMTLDEIDDYIDKIS